VVPAGFAEGVYDIVLTSVSGDTHTLSNALTVSVRIEPMRIISEESNAIPYRVPPDGETEVTFWVLVEDLVDIGNVDTVTIDLEPIGGVRDQEMNEAEGLQPQGQQFFTFTTTVDPVTPTQDEPYQLDVQVRKGAETDDGTVEIMVTYDVLGGVPPTFDQAYVNPSTVAPDGITEVTISAAVSDPDGAGTITSVVADLGPLGVGFVPLNSLDVAGQANEQTTGWYASDTFTLSDTTAEGTYTIHITASDDTGESTTTDLTLNVSTALTGPNIDAARSYIGPRKSVPKDDKTPFAIHVMVGDPNGVSDIDTVNAYFGTLGLPPAALMRDPNASESAKKALYSSADITIPPSTPLRVHEIEVVATDSTGGTANLILQIDVAPIGLLGDAPIIFEDKGYTTPKVAINDGQTRLTLYAFVRDDDDDLESVVVNLSGVGQVGPETPPDFGQVGAQAAQIGSGDGTCPTGSNTIVCMQPSFKEGRDGQWFILPDVTISSNTMQSSQPYEVAVIATDVTGKVDRGVIKVLVSTSEGFAQDRNPPALIAAVPVGSSTVEVVFSESLSALSLASNGNQFTITDRSDISQTLNIVGATINAVGNVITLTTGEHEPGNAYVLTGDNTLTDISGIALVPGKTSTADFDGFEDSDRQPVVHFVSATDQETVEIEFQRNLRPSSVKLGEGGDFDVKIFESETSAPLSVNAVNFIESGKVLEVKTDRQKSGERYRLQIENIASSAGVKLKSAVTKFFKAVKMAAIQYGLIQNQADLNGDGRVDFLDFTMFSSVYGQVFNNGGDMGGQGLSPIPPSPDSTVPHTQPATSGIPN